MTLLFNPIAPDTLRKEISSFSKEHKITFSNFYGTKEGLSYEVANTSVTIIIRIKDFHYYRIFVISANTDDLIQCLNGLNRDEYVINIPSKKDIDDWRIVLSQAGFDHYETYSRYFRKIKPVKHETSGISFANLTDVDDITNILYNHFSLYTDTLPSIKELQQMIDNQQVLVDRYKDGKVCGVSISTIKGSTAYGNLWIDLGDNAMDLSLAMSNLLIDKGVKHHYFWIRDTNTKVVKMHIRRGAIADGLKDYTFIKNKKL